MDALALEADEGRVICDKPRGADNWALIRGCPNGETLLIVMVSDRWLNV